MKIFDPQLTGSIEVKNPISGSVTTLGNVIALGSDSSLTGSFTGSFKGDGSALVGVIVDSGSWDGIFTGSAAISGSLNISGAEAIQLTVEKRIRGQYYSVYNSTAATYAGYLITSGDFEDDATTDLGLASGTGRNIRFYTANNPVEKMRLTTNGSLGIGTTTMNQFVNIKSTSNTNSAIQFKTADDSQTLNLGVVSSKGYITMESAADLQLGTSGLPRLTISSGGDVTLSGNGTTSALLFGQSSYARIINTSGQTLYVDSDVHEFRTNGGVAKLTISSGGVTTLTNSSTSNTLVLNGTSGYSYLRTQQSGVDKWAIGNITSVSDNLEFYNGTTKLTISSGGNATLNGYLKLGTSASQTILGDFGETNTYLINYNSGGTLKFLVGGGSSSNEKLTILSTGNVGIGTTPNSWTSAWTVLQLTTGALFTTDTTVGTPSGQVGLANNYYYDGTNNIRTYNGFASDYLQFNGNHLFRVAGSGNAGTYPSFINALQILSGGTVLIGATTATSVAKLQLVSSNAFYGFVDTAQVSNLGNPAGFFNSAKTFVGGISTNNTSTAFNTSSDYRLKENVKPITDALSRLNQLKPSCFNFIGYADNAVDGFIAHEVQDIVPEAISGEKDAVSEDGTPKYQGIDQSKIVPLLTAAIQEQQAQIEELKSEIQLLKNN